MRRSTQIAIFSGAGLGPVEKSVTGNAPLTISDAVTESIKALTIYGRTESGVNVGDNGLTVTSCGKNLFEIKNDSGTVGDIQFVVDKIAGTITVNGKNNSSNAVWINITVTPDLPANVDLILTGCPVGGGVETYRLIYTPNAAGTNYIDEGSGVTLQAFDYDTYPTAYLGIRIAAGYEATNLVFTPMIRRTMTNADFEPYTGSTATITTGLPLRSNGNVKDELNYPANKVITRIDSNGDVLDTPVETSLSAAEIAALQSLKTYEGTTNIFVTNDPSISVTYMTPRTTTRATKKRTTRKKK